MISTVFGSIGWNQLANGNKSLEASLTLKVVDRKGNERPYEVRSLKSFNGGGELVKYFRGLTIRGIAYGSYSVKLAPKDLRKFKDGIETCGDGEVFREISFSGPRDALVVLQVTEECAIQADRDKKAIQITLMNLEAPASSYWCSLHPTAENYRDMRNQYSAVSASGKATLGAQEEGGRFILVIYRSGQILAVAPLSIPASRELKYPNFDIDLRQWRDKTPKLLQPK